MNKTYACSDLHGMYNLWEQIRDYCDETDTIYFLGDACDRGNDGIKIIYELLKDKRVKYLKGNHEDLLTMYVPYFIEGHFEGFSHWSMNGGYATWEVLSKMSEEEQLRLVRKLNNLPESAIYDSPNGYQVFLCHAGTDLNYTKRELELRGITHPFLWDRKHFYSTHPANLPNVYQVHGHTPVQYLSQQLGQLMPSAEVVRYCDGHKFDIDMAAFATDKIALIDLDTFEVKYFYNMGEKEIYDE